MSNAVAKTRPGLGWLIISSIAGLVVLSFLAGTAVVGFKSFPYRQFFDPAYQSLRVQLAQRSKDWATDAEWRMMPCRTTERGLTKQTAAASPGYTLYVSSQTSGATLIDMEGRQVHRWHLPFFSIWPDPVHVKERVPEDSIYSEFAHVYPNGDLLVTYSATKITPYGYGLAKLDKNSKLLWSFPDQIHHQLEVAEDGTIYALAHDYRQLTEADRPPQLTVDTILEDFVVAISPDGKELWRISLFDALRQSPEYQAMAITFDNWDLLHTNAVRVIPAEFAERHAFCRAGQLLLSFRSTDTLAVLDVEERRIVWATRGFWKQQHCPIFIPGGRLMIFDNQGLAWREEWLDSLRYVNTPTPHKTSAVYDSRLVEFDPGTNQIFWEFQGSRDAPFYSRFRGYEQRLPNGNVLATESGGGRIFEITPDKSIVWEYYNPERVEHDGQECVWDIPFARRYTAEECLFLTTKPDER